jgi:N-acylneuraminate cytidylyltransferase
MINIYNETLVVIPARGGSKRIPRKNIIPICGKPMISWPLMELLKKFCVEHIIVSTDDDEIAEVATGHGLTIPFKRPAELSDDFTGTMEVVTHALDFFERYNSKVKYVLIVYPTAVLLNLRDIEEAYESLTKDGNCSLVFSATTFPFPIQRAVYEDEENYVRMFDPSEYYTRSQDLKEALHDAGQFYLCKAETVRKGLNITNSDAKVVKLPRFRVIDIDTVEDFKIAEKLLSTFKNIDLIL